MKYQMRKMSDVQAKKIIERMLEELSDIDSQDMTTFELHVLHACEENPRGREEVLLES